PQSPRGGLSPFNLKNQSEEPPMSKRSTVPTTKNRELATPSRRELLAKGVAIAPAAALAVIAAGNGAAQAMETSMKLLDTVETGSRNTAARDPIFAAIEAHRKAHAAFVAALDPESRLEETIPAGRRQSKNWSGELTIVETDAPEWIACQK